MADSPAPPPVPASEDSQSPPPGQGADVVGFWKGELGRYETEYKAWGQRCAKIIRRYRDERPEFQKYTVKYAILWSNIQTMKPAVFSKAPQPIVERRYLDSDPLANVSSQTLERAIETNLDVGRFVQSADKAVLDFLLCARGQLWARYEPEYGEASAQITKTEDPGEAAGPGDTGSDGSQEDEPSYEVRWEKVCVDYIHWMDFAHTPGRNWPEVWWVARRAWLSREEGTKRFGAVFKQIPLKRPTTDTDDRAFGRHDRAPKAEVWEIWDKASGKVCFMAPDLTARMLEVVPDPLHLSEFFPCPEPMYGTLTNDTLVPVPDYSEYQDQAEEIDNLSNRISRITAALKVVGLYAGDVTQLARILQTTVDNVMIPVDNWAVFAEKGGIAGSISFVPVKDLAAVLMTLYEAREAAKRDLYEITGMSDIIRGQASGAAKTATEQRIKSQFVSLRLDARRKEVSRFMRDVVAIVGEIIAEHFSPEMIIQMTGMLPVVVDQIKSALPPQPAAPALPPPSQGAGPGAGPPGAPSGMAPPAPQPDPQQAQAMQQAEQAATQQTAMQVLTQALMLLKNDKMRTYRIDIETDSTIEADAVMDKEEVVEFMGAMSQFLTSALPLGQAAPPLIKPLAESVKHAMRRFKMGRSVETAFDAAFEQLEQMGQAQQGQQEDPKAQAEKAKAESDIMVAQIKAQAEIQRAQLEARMAQLEMAMKEQKMMLDQEKMQRDAEMDMAKHQMGLRKLAIQAMTPANTGAQAA